MLTPSTYRYHMGFFSPYGNMIAPISFKAVLIFHLTAFAAQRPPSKEVTISSKAI